MNNLTLTAPAKLNLFLHINNQREDGYHELESLFTFLDFGDELEFNLTDDNQISIINPGGEFHITLNNDTMNYYIINTAVLEYDDIIDLSLYL